MNDVLQLTGARVKEMIAAAVFFLVLLMGRLVEECCLIFVLQLGKLIEKEVEYNFPFLL